MKIRQKLYAKEGIYDPVGNPNQPAIQQPQLAPPSTTKKDNIKRKTIGKQTQKKRGEKKTKKTDKTAVPTPKLHNADGNTVVTHGNYIPQRLYSYEVQYNDKSQPKYTFCIEGLVSTQVQITMATGVTPSVAAMCKRFLPDSSIDGIVIRSNTYALARTALEEKILVEDVMKKNPRWMHPNKY